MDAKNIHRTLQNLQKEIEQEVNDRLPRKVGVMAKNHFRQNFRNAGFTNGGNHPWQDTVRQRNGGTDSAYTPLTSRRNHLINLVSVLRPQGRKVV